MEDHSKFLLDLSYFCRNKSTEELTELLLITTMELEAARFKALQELKHKNDELTQLKHLYTTVVNEKNETQNRYKKLLLHYHRQTTAPPPYSDGISSSDCDESIVSSPVRSTLPVEDTRVPVKELPENGKFLEAVVKAGPLLQNLLLAGRLPQWRHPPPAVEAYWIPTPPVLARTPVPVNGLFNKKKKRGFCEGSDSSTETKYELRF